MLVKAVFLLAAALLVVSERVPSEHVAKEYSKNSASKLVDLMDSFVKLLGGTSQSS